MPEIIQVVGTATVTIADDGKKDIVLNIDNTELAFEEDKISATIILNGICIGSWK